MTTDDDPAPTDASPAARPLAPVVVAASATLLAACGGGDAPPPAADPAASALAGVQQQAPVPQQPGPATQQPGTPSPQPGMPPQPAAPAPFDATAAARFLQQATFGATLAEIERTRTIGAAAWIDEQLAMPRGVSHVAWLRAQGWDAVDQRNNRASANHTLWRAFLSQPDQLRQRMVYALSQILVVSINGVTAPWPAFAVAHYLDVLDEHAFGNYRDLLEAITLTPAMGTYLSMRGSRRADASGRQPDENYAREIMQLFTIGLQELDPDGTPRRNAGVVRETYDTDDVTGLARVFTGWDLAGAAALDTAGPTRAITPMEHLPARHETGPKSFLGATIPAGTTGPASLRRALDLLFAHPNVGPFLARQLIQRLVTANPSPAYVARVAGAFANDGAGVRGNLRAVLRALLLDAEARAATAGEHTGKLVEPVLRFTRWARANSVASPSGQWRLGSLADPATRLGQSPLQSPSVFNFYRPGYVPPGTSIAAAGLVSPESQIATETSVAGYLNTMQTVIGTIGTTTGLLGSDLRTDEAPWLPLADAPDTLVDALNRVLAADRLSPATRTLVRDAVASVAGGTVTGRRTRVRIAQMLVMAATETLVQT